MSTPVYTTHLWCRRGHFNEDQADKYADICRILKPRFVLEVGFCTGRSAACILHYSRRHLRRMISIDKDLDWKAPEGRQMARRLQEQFDVFTVVEADSRELLTSNFISGEFPDGIDVATIDGDHTYEGCTSDLERIAPFLSLDGVMIVDDYASGPPNGIRIDSVTRSVDDFIVNNRKRFHGEVWNSSGKGFCFIRRLKL